MLFKDIIGQEDIKTLLIKSVEKNRISHAQLFSGPEGSGKLPLALAYARYLLCNNHQANDACGKCHSCLMINKLVHPDLHFVFPVIKKATSKDFIKEWRECFLANPYFLYEDWLKYINANNSQPIIYAKESDELTKTLSLKSFEGGYKITIIWLPEKMNEESANKLLKLIEEPPIQTIFLLVSDEPDKILPTILSRIQRINIHKTSTECILQWLNNKGELNIDKAKELVHLTDGNISIIFKELNKIQNNEKDDFFNLFVNVMRLAYLRRIRELKQWSECLVDMGREKQKSFLNYSQHLIRESFIKNLHQPELNCLTIEEKKFVNSFSPYINENNIIQIVQEMTNAQNDIERNVNSKIVFFDFSLKMIMLLKQ